MVAVLRSEQAKLVVPFDALGNHRDTRLWASEMSPFTITAAFLFVEMSDTKQRSIFSVWKLNRRRYFSDEYPVPKSSMDVAIPNVSSRSSVPGAFS